MLTLLSYNLPTKNSKTLNSISTWDGLHIKNLLNRSLITFDSSTKSTAATSSEISKGKTKPLFLRSILLFQALTMLAIRRLTFTFGGTRAQPMSLAHPRALRKHRASQPSREEFPHLVRHSARGSMLFADTIGRKTCCSFYRSSSRTICKLTLSSAPPLVSHCMDFVPRDFTSSTIFSIFTPIASIPGKTRAHSRPVRFPSRQAFSLPWRWCAQRLASDSFSTRSSVACCWDTRRSQWSIPSISRSSLCLTSLYLQASTVFESSRAR